MKKTLNISLCSGSVIATALLLGATPSFAQSAEPSVSPFPEVATPAPLPEASTTATTDPVMISSPVVQPIPETEPASDEPPVAAQPAAAPVSTRTTQQPRTPRTAAAAVPAAAVPVVATDPAPGAEAPLSPVNVVPFDLNESAVADETAPPVVDDQLAEDLLPIGLGGLAVLALAIWGFIAIGRRKPVQSLAETSVRVAPKPIERTSTTSPAVAEPVLTSPAAIGPARNWSQPTASGLAHSGASVALPRSVPTSFEERDALLKRMVAARPDRANPFVSYKARVKRARLILQSLGRDFADAEPWIDLSQYSANWPDHSRSKTAAA